MARVDKPRGSNYPFFKDSGPKGFFLGYGFFGLESLNTGYLDTLAK